MEAHTNTNQIHWFGEIHHITKNDSMLKIYSPYHHIKNESYNKVKYVALFTHIKTAAFLYTADP